MWGKPIRLATKSIRSVEVLRYIQHQLVNVVGFMTFTAAETIFYYSSSLMMYYWAIQ